MIQIQPNDVSDKLRSLFSPSAPAALRCFAVLSGDNRGMIWADDADSPTWGIVQEAAFGTLYLEGSFPDGLLDMFIKDRQKQGEVLYGLWKDDTSLDEHLPPAPYDGRVWESIQEHGTTDRTALKTVPEGCKVHTIDADLFKRIQDYQFYSDIFGSPERALEHGFGLCLVRSNEVLCEAFAGTSHNDVIEIGVNTHEEHRQKRYATLTCAYLIDEAEQRGYRTYWNCAVQNIASTALANRLGFAPMKQYRLLGWF
jgi:RimJ/RimL family protein N-acetyltransferase